MPTALRASAACATFALLLAFPLAAAANDGDDDDPAPSSPPASAATSPAAAPGRDAPDFARVPRTVAITAGQSPPPIALPPPPPQGQPRTFSVALSIGPGWLALRDQIGRDSQQATSGTGRLGVVIGPEWNMTLGLDRASTRRGAATFDQTAVCLGLQRFLFDRLYLGGALGLARVAESGVPDGLSDGPAGAVSAHLGIEAVRLRHAALTFEASFTIASYSKEAWEMGGLRVGVIVF
jgi:hypothetical protein